jgi:hypothetical protein
VFGYIISSFGHIEVVESGIQARFKRWILIYYQIEAPGTVQRRKTTNNDEAVIY